MPVSHSYVGHVSARYVVTGNAATCVTRSKPVLLDLIGKSRHYDGITSKLAHIASGHFPDLGGDAVLFHEGFLGEMKLQRVVG